MPKDIGHTVKQNQKYYDTVEVKGETKQLNICPQRIVFLDIVRKIANTVI